MLAKLKARIMFESLLGRPKIEKAYAMVGPEDSWYDTITKVHQSLAQIQQMPSERLELKSHDGLKLQAVYYPAENSNGVTVICVHGYTSHAEREWAFPGLFYHSLGCNVLIPYQRAHGPSEGRYITFGALEHRDMMGWVKLINERNPEDGIVLHGLSMGGGIVLDLADKEMKQVKCLIADAPNTDIDGFFRGISQKVFKEEGAEVCRHMQERFRKCFGAETSEFDGVRIVGGSRYPILLSAGSEEHLEELFEAIQKQNSRETQVVILPGCNHGNGMYKQTELYQGRLRQFVAQYAMRK